MGDHTREVEYARARSEAEDLCRLFQPACERIEIAGSVRRQKPIVHDIEIVCIPKTIVTLDWLGMPTESNALEDLISLCLTSRKQGQSPWKLVRGGLAYKQIDMGLCNLDLFITTPEKWGVVFTLRTGSATFSHRLATPKRFGGYCPSHLALKGSRVVHMPDRTPLETPEEIDVFNALELAWREPKDRKE